MSPRKVGFPSRLPKQALPACFLNSCSFDGVCPGVTGTVGSGMEGILMLGMKGTLILDMKGTAMLDMKGTLMLVSKGDAVMGP
jgi:hypothetical protein